MERHVFRPAVRLCLLCFAAGFATTAMAGSARVQMCSAELYPSTNCGKPLRENHVSVRRMGSTDANASEHSQRDRG